MVNDFEDKIEATEAQIKKFTAMIAEGRSKGYIDIGNLSMEEWLILRSLAGIGCSEIATALNKVPAFFSKTPLKVWKEKTGHIVEIVDNPILRIGRNVEEAIVLEYEYLTGRKVLRVKDKMFLHPEHDFLFADLDGIILPAGGDGYGVLEAKSTLSYVYNEWKEKLPSYYFRQGMGELSVMSDLSYFKGVFPDTDKYMQCDYVDFATLILDKRQVEILRLNRDGEFIELQNKELELWWNEYVVMNVPPPETAAEWAKADPMEESYMEATPEGFKSYQELLNVQKEMKNLKEKEQELKDALIEEVQDNEALIYNGETIITYKQQEKSSIDGEKLKAEQPEIYEKYAKTSKFRVLRPMKVNILEY